MTKIVKDAVEAALVDVHKKLDKMADQIDSIDVDVSSLDAYSLERDMQKLSETLGPVLAALTEITDNARRTELEAGRAELRQARLLGKVS